MFYLNPSLQKQLAEICSLERHRIAVLVRCCR